jgi:hypothetical protein
MKNLRTKKKFWVITLDSGEQFNIYAFTPQGAKMKVERYLHWKVADVQPYPEPKSLINL